MSTELVQFTKKYIENVICSFESGLYKIVQDNYQDELSSLSNNHGPFITIFRDLHEKYYTRIYNSIITGDDKYIKETFDKFKKLSNHPTVCTLNLLGNYIVSVHFNINRKKLFYKNHDKYIKSLKIEIANTIPDGSIEKIFDHECVINEKLELLKDGEKFIKIDLYTKKNNNMEELKSF